MTILFGIWLGLKYLRNLIIRPTIGDICLGSIILSTAALMVLLLSVIAGFHEEVFIRMRESFGDIQVTSSSTISMDEPMINSLLEISKIKEIQGVMRKLSFATDNQGHFIPCIVTSQATTYPLSPEQAAPYASPKSSQKEEPELLTTQPLQLQEIPDTHKSSHNHLPLVTVNPEIYRQLDLRNGHLKIFNGRSRGLWSMQLPSYHHLQVQNITGNNHSSLGVQIGEIAMSASEMRNIFSYGPKEVDYILIKLKPHADLNQVCDELGSKYGQLNINTWQSSVPGLMQSIEMEDLTSKALAGIISLLAFTTLAATISYKIHSKLKTISLYRALGATKSQICLAFCLIYIVISTACALTGCLIGGLVASNLHYIGYKMIQYNLLPSAAFFLINLPILVSFNTIIATFLIAVAGCITLCIPTCYLCLQDKDSKLLRYM